VHCGVTHRPRRRKGTSGSATGTQLGDLIIGTSGDDTLHGRNGNDCIIGGLGRGDIDGGPGHDVCIVSTQAQVSRCEVIIEIR